jgi:hypothetical protein
MDSPPIVYDESREMRSRLYEKDGQKFLCPKCRAELIIALDVEAIAKHKVHPGVYCSRFPNHFFEMHELR